MAIDLPAEWAPQRAIFTAFPSDGALWLDDLEGARAEVAALVRQLARTVPVLLLAAGAEAAQAARAAVGDIAGAGGDTGAAVRVVDTPFGDIWLRDTGPLFFAPDKAVRFRFNGWGGKYLLAGDSDVGAAMAAAMGARVTTIDAILEGGAIEANGRGLVLATEECLLNENRNPGWTKKEAEDVLCHALAATRIIWLGEGLRRDHTDGHIDNLARFADATTVVVPEAWTDDDPNRAVFADAAARIERAGLAVLRVPSVGPYRIDGAIAPASHMNWVVANGQLVAPLYGTESDGPFLEAMRRIFPNHLVTGLAANHILTGGGSFHCITQQVPA